MIAIALVSSVSAMIMAGPRVYAAMATDRALPHQLAQHNQRGVPVIAVIAQGVIASVFVLVGDLGSLIRFVGFTLAIFAALTVGAVFVLRARGHRAAYRTFGYPVTPIAFIALSRVDRVRADQVAARRRASSGRRRARRRRGALLHARARQATARRRSRCRRWRSR